MEKYLKEHLDLMEKISADKNDAGKLGDWLTYNRLQIGFFQHERLIHLLVTLFVALVLIIILLANIFYSSMSLVGAEILLVVLLVFYLKHYYVLENGVQKLYRLDREMEKRRKS